MKVSKTGYKKNSKDKNEKSLLIPSNQITMKDVEFPVFGTDDTGYSQMMYPGLDYSFPGNYVYEIPMAKNGGTPTGPSKVIGGKLEISYDKDDNIYLRALNSPNWTKIDGDKGKEFKTKFAKYIPGYFDPAGNVKKTWTGASKQVSNKQQIIADKPKYQDVPQQAEKPLPQKKEETVPNVLSWSMAQQGFGNKLLSDITDPEKIKDDKQKKLQLKYQNSPDYHWSTYSSMDDANKEYEKTPDYKLRYKNINDYSTDDIPKIQEKLYNAGYLKKAEKLDVSAYKSKDQIVELQKKLAKFGLIDMLGKSGPNQDGITGTLTKETKDAVKRFNELNQTYKPGEMDDMTRQAIRDFKNATDSKNAMGFTTVNPKKLYNPETGEPYTEDTYKAMDIFENSLKSRGYFLGDKGYDISESAASNPKISFNFKLNPEPTTAFGMCAAYVNGTVCEDDVVGDEARDELGFKGSAWHISENLQNKGGQLVFSGLPNRSSVNLNGENEITGYLKSQLTSPEIKTQLQSLVGDGNLWGKNTKVRPGDVVNIFYEGSGYTEEAYNQTKSLNNNFFTTHVGIVKADDNGNLFVEHNLHGKVAQDKLQDFIDGKVKGNGKNRVSLISGITRPNYIDGVDKDGKIPVTGLSYYQTEDGKFNPRGVFANPEDYLSQSISGENTHKYLTTIEKNKNKLLEDIPISETEFGKLMRVARVIPTIETYGGKNTEDPNTLGYKITKGLKDITSEKSVGFTKLKDASNLGEGLRKNLYEDDDSKLNDPVKAALPTFYLLSKNYLYLKEVANRNNIDITSDELAKLAGLAYNQSIGKIAGELVDKGSYENYYNYRVKTASDPGGKFKYRNVMDLYDKQTMKNGGITAPGRFRNPEGNWVSKYASGGDISIPDLSRNNWLYKYQSGGEIEKNAPVSKIWKTVTGLPWSEAKNQNLTDGSFEANLELRKRLMSGEFGKISIKKELPPPVTKKTQQPVANVEKPKTIKDPSRYDLLRVDQPTAVAESTYRNIPIINKAPKIVEEVKQEAQRVKKVMKETGAKSPAEVYQKEKELEKMQQVAANQQSTLSAAPEKDAEDYMRFAADVALNPLTAAGYKIRGEEIPWGFTKGERNPLDIATDVINPATYTKATYNTFKTAIDPNTYISTLPKTFGATAGFLLGDQVPEEWNNEAIKTLGFIGDAISLAPIVPKGLSQLQKGYNFSKGFTSSALPSVSERVISKFVTPSGKLSFLEKETLDKVDELSALADRYSTTTSRGVGKKGMQNLLANESDKTALITLSENLHPDVVKKILGADVFNDVKSMLNTSTSGLSGTTLTKTQKLAYDLNDKLQKYAKSLKNSSKDPVMYEYGKKLGSEYFPKNNKLMSLDGADSDIVPLIDHLYNADKNTLLKLRGAVKTVLSAPAGQRFVGSESLSNNSWTTTTKKMDDLMTKGVVEYDGYKMAPLNSQAYSNQTGVTKIIGADLKKINNQIEQINKKNKLNIPKAYFNPTSLEVIAPYLIAKKVVVPPGLKYGGSNKWLDKYQDKGQVNTTSKQPFYQSTTEPGTYETTYLQPEVTIKPKWTEAELERNRLRDKYIEDDKRAFRHWYDKLGYDRKNVDKRAEQYAYNTLAKQYLKGDRDKLTDQQKRFIQKSEYADRLQPTVGSRFVEGFTNPGFNLETLSNLAAPLEYPTNLVRGAVKGEFADAVKGYTPSPYFVSSDRPGTSPTEAAIMSGLVDAGVDIGFGALEGLNLADDAARAGKYLTTQTPLKNAYKLNPAVLKENPEMFLYRARPVDQDVDFNMAAQLKAKEAAGEPLTWWQKNLLNPETNPQLAAREKYYGQWFEKDPSRLDFYIDPGTRNFADTDQIELLRTQLPKSEAAKLNVSQFDDARSLSASPETEYILPKGMVESSERFPESSLQQLINEDKAFNTPHWWRGFGSKKTPSELETIRKILRKNVTFPTQNKPLPDYMKPYLGKVKKPISLDEKIFRTFLSPKTQLELDESDWIHYDQEGNITSPKKYGGWLDNYKKGGVKSQGEGYYDYINGYSGIFAKGGTTSKENKWINKYK